jgi:hypothetical protein
MRCKTALESELSHHQFRSWHRVVKQHFMRKLTFASDISLALSGIVTYLRRFGAGEYLARIWKDSLLEDLLWFSSGNHGSRLKQHVEPYRAPT